MSDPNSSDNDGKPNASQVYSLLKNIFESKFSSNNRFREMYLDGSQKDYQIERQVVKKLNAYGVQWGLVASLGSFWVFRTNAISRVVANLKGVPFVATRRMSGPVNYAFGVAANVFLSVVIGSFTCNYLTDWDGMRQELSKVPLLEGRSLMSEELCGEYIHVYNLTKEQGFDWNAENALWATSFQNFVKNCHARQSYEDELRRTKGLSPTDPVVIPAPGVPASYIGNVDASASLDNFDTMETEQDTMEYNVQRQGSEEWTDGMSSDNKNSSSADDKEWSSLDEFSDKQEAKPKKSWWWRGKSS